LNFRGSQNSPCTIPVFAKQGYCTSLWKREVRRDFIKQCRYYYEAVNISDVSVKIELKVGRLLAILPEVEYPHPVRM
jgi:hypothetical protein